MDEICYIFDTDYSRGNVSVFSNIHADISLTHAEHITIGIL